MTEKERPVAKLKDFLSKHENDILLALMVIYVIALAIAIFRDVF